MSIYGSIWNSGDILCHRCHKNLKGICLKSMEMSEKSISLNLCANCIEEIANETKDFRH